MQQHPLATRIADHLVAWRWPLLAVGILLTVLAWFPAQRLAFDRSVENMFPADDPLLVPFRQLKRTFGGDELVLAAYVDPHLLDDEGIERVKQLTERLKQIPGVESVVSLGNVPYFGKKPRDATQILELFEGFLIGRDRQTTAAICFLLPEAEANVDRASTIDAIRQVIRNHDPSGVVAGEPAMVVDGFRNLEEDGHRLKWTTTLLLMLVIIVCFRSVRWVVVPVVVVQATMLWTEGVLVAGHFRLSMVSSMLAAIITVVGVATVVQLAVQFREARDAGFVPARALAAAGAALSAALFWRSLTDVAGFASLTAAKVGPVQDFGTMMAIGSFMVLLTVIFLMPGLTLLGTKDTDPRRAWGEHRLDAALRRLMDALVARPWRYVATSLGVALLASAGCFWLRVETDFTRNFRQTSPIVRSYEFIESNLGGAGVWDVYFPAPETLDLKFLNRVRKLQRRLREEVHVLDEQGQRVLALTKVLSLADVVDANPYMALAPSALKQQAISTTIFMFGRELPPIARALQGHDPQSPQQNYYRIMLRARERQPAEQKLLLIQQVEQIAREEFPDAQVTGFFVLLTNLIQSTLRDQWVTFGVAAVSIWLMMLVALRSLRLSLVSMVPNVLPILMVTGLLGWSGVRINMGAAMIAAVSIGITIDASTHYLLAFQDERRRGLAIIDALHAVHQTVGRAMIFTTLALIVGFSALVQSQFVPTIYFGVLVSLALLGGLLGNLVVLPVLIKLVEPRDPAK
jgi:hypothetical protein